MASFEISIILVNWNTRQLTLDCIKSAIADLTKFNYELIVVDNASTDGSVDAIRQTYPVVKVIQLPVNLGFAKGNNAGIRECSGEYICLMNTDVLVVPGCFEKLVNYMRTHPNVGICGPKVLNSDETLQTSIRKEITLGRAFARSLWLDSIFPSINYYAPDHTLTVDIISGCFWVVGRKALEKVGGLDESFFFYGEDRDWCLRFKKAGWEVSYFPQSKIIHFGGGSSSTANHKYYVFQEKANFQFWKKHHTQPSIALYWVVRLIHHLLRIPSCGVLMVLKKDRRREYRIKTAGSIYCIAWLFGVQLKVLQQTPNGTNVIKR